MRSRGLTAEPPAAPAGSGYPMPEVGRDPSSSADCASPSSFDRPAKDPRGHGQRNRAVRDGDGEAPELTAPGRMTAERSSNRIDAEGGRQNLARRAQPDRKMARRDDAE